MLKKTAGQQKNYISLPGVIGRSRILFLLHDRLHMGFTKTPKVIPAMSCPVAYSAEPIMMALPFTRSPSSKNLYQKIS